jgi:hypothetical protein
MMETKKLMDKRKGEEKFSDVMADLKEEINRHLVKRRTRKEIEKGRKLVEEKSVSDDQRTANRGRPKSGKEKSYLWKVYNQDPKTGTKGITSQICKILPSYSPALLFQQICLLDNPIDHCFASNERLAEICKTYPQQINMHIQELKRRKLINVKYRGEKSNYTDRYIEVVDKEKWMPEKKKPVEQKKENPKTDNSRSVDKDLEQKEIREDLIDKLKSLGRITQKTIDKFDTEERSVWEELIETESVIWEDGGQGFVFI